MIRPVPGAPCPHCSLEVVSIFTFAAPHTTYRVIRHTRNQTPEPVIGDCYEIADCQENDRDE